MRALKWALVAALIVPLVQSHGQTEQTSQSAELRGVVLDGSGAAVAGAEVTIYADSLAVSHLKSDANGQFHFSGAPREYGVEIQGPPGFAVLRTSAIPFAEGSESRFTLQVLPTDLHGETVPGFDPRAATASAQGGPKNDAVLRQAHPEGWEYGVVAQGGVGTSDRSDFKFLLLGGHAGKVLTPNLGSGLFQGNFEYSVEVFPFWQSYTPRFQRLYCTGAVPVGTGGDGCSAPYTVGGTYTGVSITPIMLRWNLTHGQRWMPWVQGAGGVVWTNHKYPAVGDTNPADIASNGPGGDTSVWNFTPQFGIGMHYFLRPRRSLDFSANAVHISSASLGDKNPGVNASVQFSVGYTWWK